MNCPPFLRKYKQLFGADCVAMELRRAQAAAAFLQAPGAMPQPPVGKSVRPAFRMELKTACPYAAGGRSKGAKEPQGHSKGGGGSGKGEQRKWEARQRAWLRARMGGAARRAKGAGRKPQGRGRSRRDERRPDAHANHGGRLAFALIRAPPRRGRRASGSSAAGCGRGGAGPSASAARGAATARGWRGCGASAS